MLHRHIRFDHRKTIQPEHIQAQWNEILNGQKTRKTNTDACEGENQNENSKIIGKNI